MRLEKNPDHEKIISAIDTMYPTTIKCLKGSHTCDAPFTSTSYGICTNGSAVVTPKDVRLPGIAIREGMAFTFTGGHTMLADNTDTTIFMITRFGYRGMLGVTQIEDRGRLAYVDGCTDSLLFGPHRAGDPCLNSLHFPPFINQSFHIHPDIRVGVVLSGKGWACLREGKTEIPLEEGSMFILDEGVRHRFRTDGDHMRVIAYHPTTDTGPTDQNHPMINRTFMGNLK